jgi:hypothetical protein
VSLAALVAAWGSLAVAVDVARKRRESPDEEVLV